jgi:hypothetical protein
MTNKFEASFRLAEVFRLNRTFIKKYKAKPEMLTNPNTGEMTNGSKQKIK